ncbi:MAG: thioredoxin-like domain-containing protein [Bacteroidales bacterium]
MNKLMSGVTLLLALLTTSFVDKNAKPGIGLSEGSSAPEFQIDNLKSESLKGKKVLVSFWAAYDARSRVNNSLLAANLKKMTGDIELVSIGFDESSLIFEETVRMEHLERSTQHHERNGKNSDIFRAYRLKEGFTNYLLDEHGVIIAKNLNPKELKELMSMNH